MRGEATGLVKQAHIKTFGFIPIPSQNIWWIFQLRQTVRECTFFAQSGTSQRHLTKAPHLIHTVSYAFTWLVKLVSRQIKSSVCVVSSGWAAPIWWKACWVVLCLFACCRFHECYLEHCFQPPPTYARNMQSKSEITPQLPYTVNYATPLKHRWPSKLKQRSYTQQGWWKYIRGERRQQRCVFVLLLLSWSMSRLQAVSWSWSLSAWPLVDFASQSGHEHAVVNKSKCSCSRAVVLRSLFSRPWLPPCSVKFLACVFCVPQGTHIPLFK